jgi:hypothetical protein
MRAPGRRSRWRRSRAALRACASRTRRRRWLRRSPDRGRVPRCSPPGWAASLGERREQPHVVGAAAAGVHRRARRVWRTASARRDGREFRAAWPARPRAAVRGSQLGLEPVHVEQLAPGALRRRQAQVGLVQQRRSKPHPRCRCRPSGRRRRIRGLDALKIQASSSRLAGPVSKPVTGWPRLQDGDVGDAAQVGDDAILGVAAKHLIVKYGSSGAPWPPAATSRRRKSATTRDAGHLGQHVGIADLPGEGAGRSGRWRSVWP